MDLLATFHMEELPEQQTRTLDLMSRFGEDFDRSLGFDACCTCGAELREQRLTCPRCRRVAYCSEACRELDANTASEIVASGADGEDESALGHTAVVCALLNLCRDDEAVDATISDGMDAAALDETRRQAASDRVRSEYESYPATLANVISESACFQSILSEASTRKTLIVHIIGASTDSEFWNSAGDSTYEYADGYAEALADLSDSRCLETIQLYLVGPECPDDDVKLMLSMSAADKTTGNLVIHSYKTLYNKDFLSNNQIPSADIVIFFNPGFTVPDYDWRETLACIKKGTPFIATTNTELEGIADCQYLLDQDRIQTIPPGLAHIFDLYSAPDQDDDELDQNSSSAYFGINPFAGSRVRQSGTMANDLYVKNQWMLNGIMDSFEATRPATSNLPKKQRKVEPNTKEGNPALI